MLQITEPRTSIAMPSTSLAQPGNCYERQSTNASGRGFSVPGSPSKCLDPCQNSKRRNGESHSPWPLPRRRPCHPLATPRQTRLHLLRRLPSTKSGAPGNPSPQRDCSGASITQLPRSRALLQASPSPRFPAAWLKCVEQSAEMQTQIAGPRRRVSRRGLCRSQDVARRVVLLSMVRWNWSGE